MTLNGVFKDCPKWVLPIISGTGKATDFKFGLYITFTGSIGTKAH